MSLRHEGILKYLGFFFSVEDPSDLWEPNMSLWKCQPWGPKIECISALLLGVNVLKNILCLIMLV